MGGSLSAPGHGTPIPGSLRIPLSFAGRGPPKEVPKPDSFLGALSEAVSGLESQPPGNSLLSSWVSV